MSQKCILILVDGMRPDAMALCGHPFYPEFLERGAVELSGRSVMPSVTLPCHVSLFHSEIGRASCRERVSSAV